jgi:hypothetical protein
MEGEVEMAAAIHEEAPPGPVGSALPERRKNVMETIIETLVTGLGNGVGFVASSGILFLVFAIAWLAFGAALVWSQGSLDAAWQWTRSLPLLVQGVVWLLFLPVMMGLWVWETTWPLAVRLVVVLGIAGWNLLVFLPRAAGRG